jgi:hypothetical protein
LLPLEAMIANLLQRPFEADTKRLILTTGGQNRPVSAGPAAIVKLQHDVKSPIASE